MIRPSDLHGAWHLRAFTIAFDDGRPDLHPFGEAARGLLVYSPDGWMSAVLSRADRAPLGVDRLESSWRATPAAKAAAFDGYLSYGGTWRLMGDTVVHSVTLAQTPELVGQDNRRCARLEGDTLTLSYTRTGRSGVLRTHTLTWSRHAPDA